jgi:aminoglycoside phosphotransferase (APT) family kinase protein
MTTQIDSATTVRQGEELPVAALERYIHEHLENSNGALYVEQFAHGHSNLTYLLRIGEQELVLRREPFHNPVKSAHDMGREYRVLSKLHLAYAPAPRPILYCEDAAILGAPFYLMERRRGVILRQQSLMDLEIDWAMAHRLSMALIDNLALLHSLDYRAIGLSDLGKPEGYTARQVAGWASRYDQAKTKESPVMDRIALWLGAHQPPDVNPALIHNDYKYDNIVLDPADLTNIIGVLDWEMATVGCPLMDLGTTLGYWVDVDDPPALRQAAMGPTNLPGSLTRQRLVDRYAERTGRDVSGVLFHYVFGLFKIAVIVQQIHARYVRGSTQDARFARLSQLVDVLADQAARTLDLGRL